jgi:hypothetical protein
LDLAPEKMWNAKGFELQEKEELIVDAIVEEIAQHAQKLIQRWGRENPPPPCHFYSLDNVIGGGLHVIQKTFLGDFEVSPYIFISDSV